MSKVEAIKAIDVPTKVRDVQRFVGLINYYRDISIKHAHTLVPITKICSTKFKFIWTDVENNAFVVIKRIVVRDVLQSYPTFSEKYIIHTDSRKTHIWGVISQNGKPIGFYSHKLAPAQINYTNT